MHAIVSAGARVAPPSTAREPREAPIEATAAALELIASEQPGLLEFQVHVLRNSTMSFAVEQLAAALEVPVDQVVRVIRRACLDLDRLEKYRGAWRHPKQIVTNPNLAALSWVCRARKSRAKRGGRQLRLARIRQRIDTDWEQTKTRAWLDEFLAPLPVKGKGGAR